MAYLSVKLDHVAVLREARRKKSPELAHAAVLAELGGADGISIHLRRDRRHIRERDLYILREVVRTRLNVETAATEENITRMLEVKPYMVIFVPEIDKEITTQSGLNLTDDYEQLEEAARRLQEVGVKVGLLIDPSGEAVKRAVRMRVEAVKLFTGGDGGFPTAGKGLQEKGGGGRTARGAGQGDPGFPGGAGVGFF